jgi:hypothetical protein
MPSLRILGPRILGPKYPRGWPRLRSCWPWPGRQWSRCPTPPPPPHSGGSTTPSARDLLPAQASPPDRLAKGLMAPLPATTEAATPLPSLAHPSTPAWSYPSHPHRTMGGIPEGSMAPLPATTEATKPSPSSACPFLPTWRRTLECSQQHLAFTMSKYPRFADENPWVMENINAVARELQCWY